MQCPTSNAAARAFNGLFYWILSLLPLTQPQPTPLQVSYILTPEFVPSDPSLSAVFFPPPKNSTPARPGICGGERGAAAAGGACGKT